MGSGQTKVLKWLAALQLSKYLEGSEQGENFVCIISIASSSCPALQEEHFPQFDLCRSFAYEKLEYQSRCITALQ